MNTSNLWGRAFRHINNKITDLAKEIVSVEIPLPSTATWNVDIWRDNASITALVYRYFKISSCKSLPRPTKDGAARMTGKLST